MSPLRTTIEYLSMFVDLLRGVPAEWVEVDTQKGPMSNTLRRAHASAQAQRFSIDIERPDGSAEHIDRIGGNSMQHTVDAMERAGLGGVVRVRVIGRAAS